MNTGRYQLTVLDIFVVGFLGLAALAILVGILLWPQQQGTAVQVYVQGELVHVWSLDADGEYRIEGVGGTNTLTIAEGQARMTEADCKDAVCRGTGSISQAGEQIICLPHQVQVRVVSAEQQKVDVILP